MKSPLEKSNFLRDLRAPFWPNYILWTCHIRNWSDSSVRPLSWVLSRLGWNIMCIYLKNEDFIPSKNCQWHQNEPGDHLVKGTSWRLMITLIWEVGSTSFVYSCRVGFSLKSSHLLVREVRFKVSLCWVSHILCLERPTAFSDFYRSFRLQF